MASNSVKRAFKYRFYPTDEQEAELRRTFGCVRTVYNLALEARTEAWREDGGRINYDQTSALLTLWKQTEELAFLAEVSSVPLQQALRHLNTAFIAFWNQRSGYPRFKSRKKTHAAAEYTRSGFRWRGGELTLARMTEPLEVVWSRSLPEGAEPSTVTVSCDSAGRWFISILCEDPRVQALPATDAEVGIDAGLNFLLTLSTGEKISNPRHERRDRARLVRQQRALSRKTPGSRNWVKQRRKVARVHARTADRRRHDLHELTTRLVRENQTLVIENLAVSNMIRNRKVARAISDAGWRTFRNMLEYKASWYGRNLIVVDRWFPSSKLCSACGALAESMPLSVRVWTCAHCGVSHDRDINAAKNILAAGQAVTACGDDVRPRRNSPGGRSSAKQEPRAREGRESRFSEKS
ncbi:RNA-guided endonuclease InsQ/TnpB family protein [Nocardia sp. NPDC020380]|uniref:RNA-guided endonuclease InsQ/TnpB family protein n=1 Tax=Nocardia sp. NPDC020380 TaxID=3364309 RepID=UPI0037AEDD5C